MGDSSFWPEYRVTYVSGRTLSKYVPHTPGVR